MSLPEFIFAAISLGLELYGAWHRPGFVWIRQRLLGSTSTPALVAPPDRSATASAAEILKALPPGATVYYEAPDGSRLLVWWVNPASNGGADSYRLW